MTDKIKKEYEVSQEIVDLFDSANSAELCRDKSLDSLWGTKRAIEYGRQAIEKRRKAWRLFFELYPELENKTLQYFHKEELVKVVE